MIVSFRFSAIRKYVVGTPGRPEGDPSFRLARPGVERGREGFGR